MNGDDVRVREATGDRSLTGEPGNMPTAVRAPAAGEDLDRDQAVDLRVVRLPDLPEPARPDQLDQPVAPVQHSPCLHDSPFAAHRSTR